jgi:hypothetical protein
VQHIFHRVVIDSEHWLLEHNTSGGLNSSVGAAASAAAVKQAAKVPKAELLEDMLLKARGSGKQSVLKRSRAHAVIASSDDDEQISVFDRIRSNTGAPKSVKAARREKRARTVADLLMSEEDNFSE